MKKLLRGDLVWCYSHVRWWEICVFLHCFMVTLGHVNGGVFPLTAELVAASSFGTCACFPALLCYITVSVSLLYSHWLWIITLSIIIQVKYLELAVCIRREKRKLCQVFSTSWAGGCLCLSPFKEHTVHLSMGSRKTGCVCLFSVLSDDRHSQGRAVSSENWWNAADTSQQCARQHRLGKSSPILILQGPLSETNSIVSQS